MAVSIATVMDSLGTALSTISGLRVFDFPPDSAVPPFAYVDMPSRWSYDETFGRGFDRGTFNVVVGIGSQVDRVARDLACEYAAGTGSKSIKAAIEAALVGSSVRVQSVEFRPVQLAASTYHGLVFTVDVLA